MQKSVRDEEDVPRAVQIVHTMIDREIAAGTNPEDVFVFGLSQGGRATVLCSFFFSFFLLDISSGALLNTPELWAVAQSSVAFSPSTLLPSQRE
jgi:hypothetical protein